MKHAKHIKIRKIHTHIHKIQTYAHMCACVQCVCKCPYLQRSDLIMQLVDLFLSFCLAQTNSELHHTLLSVGLGELVITKREIEETKKDDDLHYVVFITHTLTHTYTHTHTCSKTAPFG
jgi:hypothetical protein